VKDAVDALAFDYAVTYRLYLYDREKEMSFAKYQAVKVMQAYAGKSLDDE
jgi:hypothetical protein